MPALLLGSVFLAACGGDNVRPTAPPPVTRKPGPAAPEPKVGIALGGGAAKGFAHIGVIKMLEANGIWLPRIFVSVKTPAPAWSRA